MLAATLLLFAGAVQAQQTFLREPALYPVHHKRLAADQSPAMFDFTGTKLGDVQFKCQYMAGLNFYDIQPLAIAQSADGGYSNVTGADNPLRRVYISFCQDLPELLWCTAKQPTMAVMVTIDPETFEEVSCVTLSGESPTKNAAFNVSDPDNNDGLAIQYTGGDEGYKLTVDIQCDHDNKFVPLTTAFADDAALLISFKSQFGCKYDQLSEIWNFFNNNKWAMFVALTVGGMVLCFAGRAMLKPTLFIVGVLTACLVIIFIFYSTFLKANTEKWVGYAVLAGAVIAGLILGWLLTKFQKVGAFALAGWGGFSLGLVLYNAFVYKISGEPWLFYVTVAGCALAVGLLTLVFFDHILIWSTSALGAFMVPYGIGLVAGDYPNPFTLAELIKNGQLDNINPLYYAYMGGTIVLFIVGLLVQYRHKRNNPDHVPETRFSDKARAKYGRR